MICVTGAAGFIGGRLGAHLAESGAPVVLVRRNGSDFGGLENLPSVRTLALDLRSWADLARAFVRFEVDTVVHLATGGWGADLPTSVADSIGVAAGVVEAAKQSGVRRLVLGSSIALFGASTRTPFREVAVADSPGPHGPGLFKLWEEQLLTAFGGRRLETTAVRIAMVHGPGYRSMVNLPSRICAAIAHGEPLVVERPPAYGDFVHVDDVVDGLARIALHPGDLPVAHLGAGRGFGRSEFVAAATALGAGPVVLRRIEQLSDWDTGAYLDLTRTAAATGYRPRFDLLDGMTDFLAWHRCDHPACGLPVPWSAR